MKKKLFQIMAVLTTMAMLTGSVSFAASAEETKELPTEAESEINGETEPDSEVNAETAPEGEVNAETAPESELNGETEPPADEMIPGVPKLTGSEAMDKMLEDLVLPRLRMGETWAISMEDMKSGQVLSFNEEARVLSASVIKVFIMATVYDRICYPDADDEPVNYQESYDGELKSLLTAMITVSDNDAANQCVTICGGGNFESGKEAVNRYCEENGYENVHLGRRFLDPAPTDDNYISAKACRKILSDIYHGRCVNEEASAKMLELLKGQQVRYKIPAGLPGDFTCGNKTGEMPLGYGLGCIENDIAIIFSPDYDYSLVVLSSDLEGRNSEADHVIAQISGYTANHLSELFVEETVEETEEGTEDVMMEGPVEEDTEEETAIA